MYSSSSGITPAQKEEVWKAGADAKTVAGGRLEHMSENKGLFLTRTYLSPVDADIFLADTRRLAEASLNWREQILPRALESANQKKAPASR